MTRALPRGWSGALAALLLLMPLTTAAAPPSERPAPDDPAALVDVALAETVAALAPTTNAGAEAGAPARAERLRAVLTRYFDVAQLGRNSVGAGWKLVAPAQQADFLATFESFLATGYVDSLGHAGDLRFSPARVIAAPDLGDVDARTMVRVDVRVGDEPPSKVLVALSRGDDGCYRIVDVTAESISLGRVLAADFGAFLKRNGGRLEALVAALHDKIAIAVRAH
jgi:phospholipid transport system substrate-binding protein